MRSAARVIVFLMPVYACLASALNGLPCAFRAAAERHAPRNVRVQKRFTLYFLLAGIVVGLPSLRSIPQSGHRLNPGPIVFSITWPIAQQCHWNTKILLTTRGSYFIIVSG